MILQLIICWMSISNHRVQSQILDYPIANLSNNWIHRISAPNSYNRLPSDSNVTAILLRQSTGIAYACGFFCNGLCDTFLFGIALLPRNNASGRVEPWISPQQIWLANRNNPVKINSTLRFTGNSNLVLNDADGSIVWSTNTGGRSVAGMNLSDRGNLIMFDENKSRVWQSFDHPTDSLAPGQQLQEGQGLVASVSSTNVSEGLYSCFYEDNMTHFAVGTNPPQVYLRVTNDEFPIGALGSSQFSLESRDSNSIADYYLKLESDGHLRQYNLGSDWGEATDVFAGKLSVCGYPLACGEYGICQNGQCSCPQPRNDSKTYFRERDSREPNLGCSGITPIDCNAASLQSLIPIEQATYFTFQVDIDHTNINRCKEACLGNCSCKAAIFRYETETSDGDCYLPNEIFSLLDSKDYMSIYHTSVFLKVQSAPVMARIAPAHKTSIPIVLGSTIGALLSLVLAIALLMVMNRRRLHEREIDDNSFEAHVHGMPTRFSLEELRVATEDFSIKLGEGGFGSVFQGSFNDGTKIAVKCLEGVGQVKNSFLAEVASIGNIHHVNLVRLIGYCAEKSQRLLVYEYMANGSLDKWIDSRRSELPLSWEYRRKIVLDIAKGLAYLHEDCRHKIIHLDVKPENILLGENFEAKLSDFGLSKLLSRDQSKVHTTMRGTPGYLAPEWLSSVVTEKADVYSFGVVILEILCGRKIIDESQSEDQVHLLSLFTQKAWEGKLLDIVDESCEDIMSNVAEVLKMMQVAVWCLQTDFSLRPAMSFVVKVLEGGVDVDLNHLDYNSIGPLIFAAGVPRVNSVDATLLFPSVLSGPR